MGRSKQLFEETRVLTNVNDDVRNYFIRQWFEFCPKDQSPKELAESVQDNFGISTTEDDVVKCFGLDLEEDDVKFMISNLGIYY